MPSKIKGKIMEELEKQNMKEWTVAYVDGDMQFSKIKDQWRKWIKGK